MGFYASRPELKQRTMRLTRKLLLAESLSALKPAKPVLEAALREGWLNLVLMNHHDAITGTSPDRISHGEHRDWLDNAEAAAGKALSLAADDGAPSPQEDQPPVLARGARWRGRELQIQTIHHRLTFSKERGGCLTSLVFDGDEQLRGLGLDLVAHADDGGLWRLGHEYRGGAFQEVDRASRRPARMAIVETEDAVRVVIESDLRGKRFTRTITCGRTDPFIGICIEGFAARRVSVTCRFEMVDNEVALEMDTVGGSIERPRERVHQPTFWPVPSLLTLQGTSGGVHVGFETPTAVSFSPDHALEWIVARNPMKERAFGLLPVLAHPIGGTVDELQTHRAAMFVTRGRGVCNEVRRCLENGWLSPAHRELKEQALSLVRCDDPAVSFAALKRADAGGGVILRLACDLRAARTVRVWIPLQPIAGAFLCNAREETLGPLAIEAGQVLVPLEARLTTIRLVVPSQHTSRPAPAVLPS
jgi:hypothetical protein